MKKEDDNLFYKKNWALKSDSIIIYKIIYNYCISKYNLWVF